MDFIGWILLIVALVVVGAIAWAIGAYNGFVRQRNLIQESWRQVDVELNRRYELIPNLVETVRAFAAHERNTLSEITSLRTRAQGLAQSEQGGVPSAARAQAEAQLSGAVRNLLVSVEAYPQLQSNQNFLELQRQLAETEDRIANGRRYYNANVRNYNTQVESVPTNILAGMFHFEKATYFEVNDAEVRAAPDVNFGEISYRGDAPQVARPDAPGQVAASDPNALPNPQQQPYPPQQSIPQQPYPQQPYPQQAYPQQPGAGYAPPQQGPGYVPPQSYPQQGPGYTPPQG